MLLRYFERKSAREMGETLGVTDEAAQKRVRRAVERLREFFAKRGVATGASGLGVVLSAYGVQAAPVALAATISAATALTQAHAFESAVVVRSQDAFKGDFNGLLRTTKDVGYAQVLECAALRRFWRVPRKRPRAAAL